MGRALGLGAGAGHHQEAAVAEGQGKKGDAREVGAERIQAHQPGPVAGKGFVVLSGFDDGKIFYLRTNFGGDGVLHTLLMRYPAERKANYDLLVAPIASSLKGP